jgi:hypothetical protein
MGSKALLTLTVVCSDRDRCEGCDNGLLASGFVLADQTGRRSFRCLGCTVALLRSLVSPAKGTFRQGAAALGQAEAERAAS